MLYLCGNVTHSLMAELRSRITWTLHITVQKHTNLSRTCLPENQLLREYVL